jgi:hypothetical protein
MVCRRLAAVRSGHQSMQESCQSANGVRGIRVLESPRILGEAGDHTASICGHASVSRQFRNVSTTRDGGMATG